MHQRTKAQVEPGSGIGRVPALALALVMVGIVPARADPKPSPDSATEQSAPRGGYPQSRSSLEVRVQTLAKALNLDADQQTQLRMVLAMQREQVGRVWSDAAIPAAYRVSATRAISNQTADRIRALLTEEQRSKFNAPTPAREDPVAPGTPSVEDWVKAAGTGPAPK